VEGLEGNGRQLALVEVTGREGELVLHVERVALLHLPHARFDEATPEVSPQEILEVGWMNAPVVTFPVLAAFALAKTLVQREIMTHAVPPSRRCRAKVRIDSLDANVDILQAKFLLPRAENDASYHLDVGHVWFEFGRSIASASIRDFSRLWRVLFVIAVGESTPCDFGHFCLR